MSAAPKRFDLSGKTALVTGASQGIGRGIAIALAEHGADIAIVDRAAEQETEKVAAHIRTLGRKAWVYRQDIAQSEQLAAVADRVWTDAGKIDILVNNAGMAYLERFNLITIEHWRRIFAVNVEGVFFLTQRIAERMIAAGIKGRIINVSSKNGFVAEAGLAHYNATKGAIELLTRTLAIELGQHGITANTIAPGCIQTEIGHDFAFDSKGFEPYCQEHIPLGRLGTVEDCAGIVVFLASPAAAYINGQHIINDGGVLAEQMPRMQFMPPYKNTVAKKA